MTFEEMLPLIQAELAEEAIVRVDENCTPKAVELKKEALVEAMQFLHKTEGLYFDQLSCITALDNGPEAATMELIYQLYSIPYNHQLTIKVTIDRATPEIDSLTAIWKTADWHEREAYDLLGVRFTGHPDLRRILLPADWEGHPLRKDYKHQEYYRGVKVEY